MKTRHTKGEWQSSQYSPIDFGVHSNIGDGRDIALVRGYADSEEAVANVRLIVSAPELLQMVHDLTKCIERLVLDDLTQEERDKEAEWSGNARELLYQINPEYNQ